MRLIVLISIFLSGIAFAQKDIFSFEGTITNRTSDSMLIQNNKGFKKYIPINDKQLFSADFSLEEGMYYCSIKRNFALLYLRNGMKIEVKADEKNFDATFSISGDLSVENTFVKQQFNTDNKLEENEKAPADMLQIMSERLKFVKDNLTESKFDAQFKKVYLESYEAGMKGNVAYYENLLKAVELHGKPSPDFNFENHKGGLSKLADFKGKYIYVDVWATWCGPCKAEIPSLKKVEEAFHDSNIAFVSISVDKAKDHDKWKEFVNEKGLTGVQLFADKDWSSDFVTGYFVKGIPRFILIDPNGLVLNANAPRPSDPALIELLKGLK
jgi:thiol-disulfide isomerase/thioredoxin